MCCRFWLLAALCLLPLTAAAQDDDLGEVDDKPSAPADADADDEATEESAPAEDANASKPAPEAKVEAADPGPSIVIKPYGGVGFGTRSFRRPVSSGAQVLSPSAVPAVEVGLGVIIHPNADFSWLIALAYQSALGFKVTEPGMFSLDNEVHGRSERASLDFGPRWRFGALHLGIAVGATIRTLWPEVHTLLTPGYSLIGPHARLQLEVRIAGPVVVRIAPEAQWIVHVDEELWNTGLRSQGMALGGEVGVNVQLAAAWELGVNYRESHAIIATTRDFSFTDVERYLTLRLTGAF